MALNEAFVEFVKDQLSGLGVITIRKMFGGAGVYCDGVIFGLVADDTLYLKVDEVNRPDFETFGMGPFIPFEDEPYAMQYYEVPVDVLEDRDELSIWAARACEASLRKQAKKRGRKR